MFDKLKLPFAFALIGFLLSTRRWILFLNRLSPVKGLIVYYTLVTITVMILEYFGLVIGDQKFTSINHTIGSIMIIFSYFILVNWESCYINMVVNNKCDDKEMSNIFVQSEDGSVYYLWSKLTTDLNKLRYLTYVLTPFVLSFIGGMLITEKVSLSVF
jgi:hypothetical protein